MICVIGDSILDEYIFGKSERLSPEAPVPVIHQKNIEIRLGGSANVVNNLWSLGNEVNFLTVIGDDIYGQKLESLLEQTSTCINGIVKDPYRCTTVKTRIISDTQQICRLDNEETSYISIETEKNILGYFKKNIDKFKIVVFSDYSKGMLTESLTKKLIEICNKNNIISIVDPKGKKFEKYHGATFITPNRKEVEIALEMHIKSDMDILKALQKLNKNYSISNPIITLSEKGIAALVDNKMVRFDSNVKEVFDVTGAGDTVVAVLAHYLNTGSKIEDAISKANFAGGIAVGKQGTSIVSIKEIEQTIGKSKKVVFTNGCFDILHRGHLEYLKKAKALGDYLIVGINTDESVKRLKGVDRPINCLSDRIQFLESLKFVDRVIPFSEDNPYELIKSIKPDILVKGGDYKTKEIIGSDLVDEVIVIGFVEGYSTTNFLKKIRF